MQLYVTDEDVRRQEARLPSLDGLQRRQGTILLAWHLRQRDVQRAQQLLQGIDGDAAGPLAARLFLTRGECALHLAELDNAEQFARQALAAAKEPAARGDVAHLLARILESRGERLFELEQRQMAVDQYRAAQDIERIAHARAALLIAGGLGASEANAAEAAAIRREYSPLPPSVAIHLALVDGFTGFQLGRFLDAVPHLTRVYTEADNFGMIEQGLRAGLGLASAYSNLGDREACSALCEGLLARTRALGWPRMISHALSNLGRQLSDGGSPERAIVMLEEARELIADQPRSRGYGVATYYLGDALLAAGRAEEALKHLESAEKLMQDLGALPEVACLRAVGAQALSRVGRPAEALAKAESALALARETQARMWEVESLRSLAEVHMNHKLPGAQARPVEFLERALAVVAEIGGHHETGQLHEELSRAYEAAGDLPAALKAEREARQAEKAEASRRASNMVLLAQVRYETEKQRLDADHQRSLVAAEASRARELETSLETLAHLGHIGQEITARHDVGGILDALNQHIGNLTEVHYMAVSLLEKDGKTLIRSALDDGKPIPLRRIDISALDSNAARCARERREILQELEIGQKPETLTAGVLTTHTAWFGPLIVQEKLLGVLTIQSRSVHAYRERELLVFRTLAAYAAVALANAAAYRELDAANAQLRRAESELRALAATDSLTGIPNRRSFVSAAEAELKRSRRTGKSPALILGDLDHFKRINDTLGHPAGDMVLTAVALLLASLKRNIDTVGRMGGEEFALLLPESDIEAAHAAAERLRQAVETAPLRWEGRPVPVTMSFGCAVLPDPGNDSTGSSGDPNSQFDVLFKLADEALYAAKNEGRNRTVARSARG